MNPLPGIGAATRFDAIGTYVYVATRRPEDLATAESLARQILQEVDETCSRFRPDSDLSVVNQHAGHWVQVDALLIEALRVACSAAEQTDGLVNPLLGRPLTLLGYDRDFAELREVDLTVAAPLPPPPPIDAWRGILFDNQRAVRIPEETALDLGATGKAWATDLIATALATELDCGAIVSVGGDIAIAHSAGEADAGADGWPVAISERPDSPVEETIRLSGGGLATSSTLVRRWTRGGVRQHHLLDPRTGLPCAPVWRTVTTTGPTCTAANIASTAAIVLGTSAPQWLYDRAVTARLVDSTGFVRTIGPWGTG